jgi:hypothetical protein
MPEQIEKPADPPKLRHSQGGRRAAFGFFLLILVSLLYYRSYHHADVMAVFGPGGKIGGLLSHRGQLFFAFSNIDCGSNRAWTIETVSASPEAGAQLRGVLTGDAPSTGGGGLFGPGLAMNAPAASSAATTPAPPVVSQKWGFLVGRHENDALGLQGKWISILAIPHWLLIPITFWPILTWAARKNRQRRRRKTGCCLNCGYDLRDSKDRCPECGAEIPTAQPNTPIQRPATNN